MNNYTAAEGVNFIIYFKFIIYYTSFAGIIKFNFLSELIDTCEDAEDGIFINKILFI